MELLFNIILLAYRYLYKPFFDFDPICHPHNPANKDLLAGVSVRDSLNPSAADRGGLRAGRAPGHGRDGERGDVRLYLPAGAGRVAFVDTRAIAEVAASCLLDPAAHQGQAYSLTGAQALSLREVAQLLSEALGRPIRYEPASIPGYIQHLRRQGAPLDQIAVMTALHVGLRLGQGAPIDPALPRLLGHPPRSLQEYIREPA